MKSGWCGSSWCSFPRSKTSSLAVCGMLLFQSSMPPLWARWPRIVYPAQGAQPRDSFERKETERCVLRSSSIFYKAIGCRDFKLRQAPQFEVRRAMEWDTCAFVHATTTFLCSTKTDHYILMKVAENIRISNSWAAGITIQLSPTTDERRHRILCLDTFAIGNCIIFKLKKFGSLHFLRSRCFINWTRIACRIRRRPLSWQEARLRMLCAILLRSLHADLGMFTILEWCVLAYMNSASERMFFMTHLPSTGANVSLLARS